VHQLNQSLTLFYHFNKYYESLLSLHQILFSSLLFFALYSIYFLLFIKILG